MKKYILIVLMTIVMNQNTIMSMQLLDQELLYNSVHYNKCNNDNIIKLIAKSIRNIWFGKIYTNTNVVTFHGNIKMNIKPLNLIQSSSLQYYITNHANINTTNSSNDINLTIDGIYSTNADFRIIVNGTFGNLIYYRLKNKGFLYTNQGNIWTNNINLPPMNTQNNFQLWFDTILDNIITLTHNKAEIKIHNNFNMVQTIELKYPPSKNKIAVKYKNILDITHLLHDGIIKIDYDLKNYLPKQIYINNHYNGIILYIYIYYNNNGGINNILLINHSKSAEGPGIIEIQYDKQDLINLIKGNLKFDNSDYNFIFDISFEKIDNTSSIATIPPPTAIKKSREEVELAILSRIIKKITELQFKGFNLQVPIIN